MAVSEEAPPFASARVVAPTVEVTAPSTLDEGYTFDAIYNGQVFSVVVPPGGVKAGQTFRVPFVPTTNAVEVVAEPLNELTPILPTTPSRNNNNNNNHRPNPNAPLGMWNTGLFDCCSEGCCHPSLCNAVFVPQILMGQVLSRMKLDWCGNPAIGRAYKQTTCTWILLTVVYFVARVRLGECAMDPSNTVVGSTLENLDDDVWKDLRHGVETVAENARNNNTNNNINCTEDDSDLLTTIQWIWFIVTVVVLARLRSVVRKSYEIPKGCCAEDLACSVFCGCCTVSQLARQTADYQHQRAYCCTEMGLAEGV